MKFTIMQDDQVVQEIVTQAESNVLPVKKEKSQERPVKISISGGFESDCEADSNVDREPKEIKLKPKKSFSIYTDGEDELSKPTDKNIPKPLDEKPNENISSSEFGGGVGESYQNKELLESESEDVEESKAEYRDPIGSDINMVKSLTLIPREDEYPYDNEALEDAPEADNSGDEEYESKTVIKSY